MPDRGLDTIIREIGPEICEVVTASADEAFTPADIIWVIDSSESMDNEIAIVRTVDGPTIV